MKKLLEFPSKCEICGNIKTYIVDRQLEIVQMCTNCYQVCNVCGIIARKCLDIDITKRTNCNKCYNLSYKDYIETNEAYRSFLKSYSYITKCEDLNNKLEILYSSIKVSDLIEKLKSLPPDTLIYHEWRDDEGKLYNSEVNYVLSDDYLDSNGNNIYVI